MTATFQQVKLYNNNNNNNSKIDYSVRNAKVTAQALQEIQGKND